MTTKTVVGVITSVEVYLWSILYEQPWRVDDDLSHPDAQKPDPRDLEMGIYNAPIPLLRALTNLLSINLGAAFKYDAIAVGVQAMLCDEAPPLAEFSDVEHWSEVSVSFEKHKDADEWEGTLGGGMGDEPSDRYPELRELKIPPGTWRVRAEVTTAPGGLNEFRDMHINQITPGEFAAGKGTWGTLPFQLKLWFWPETELRPATHSPTEQEYADKYELAEHAYIKKWRQEKGIE